MSTLKSPSLLQGVNVLGFLLTIVVNALANTYALNGRTTGEISDLYPTLITPAGYVFSIWGLIYTLLLVFVVFQALPKQRGNPFLGKISFLFVLSSILNIAWLLLWQYLQISLSVIPMFALLATLIAIYLRLQIGKSSVSLKEKICVHLPFSVYLGWITVASVANVAAALVAAEWGGWGISDVAWATVVLVMILVITLAVIVTRKDVAYGLVIVWSLVGIAVKQSENQGLVTTTEVGAITVVVAMVAAVFASRVKH